MNLTGPKGADDWSVSVQTQVASWHCDAMGHLNARHIASIFDDATAVYFTANLGYDPRSANETGVGWADRSLHIDYLAEARAGDVIKVETRVARLGSKSITLQHRLVNLASGEQVGAAEVVTVCFDLRSRTSREVPAAIRERCASSDAQA